MNIARTAAFRWRFGRNEECGLRCLYHGWKMDVEGNVLEMASEPPESGFVEKVKHKAYPAREWGGFVWTYMGPAETMPEFEPPAFAPTEQTRVSIVKIHVPCNWAQILEGQIDSAHCSSLHSSDMVPAKVEAAKAHRHPLAAPLDRQARRACKSSAPTSASTTPRSAGRSPNAQHPRLRAHHGLYRAVHRADSAEQHV